MFIAAIISTLIWGAIIAIGGYFIIKFTLDWIMNKIDEYFFNKEVDSAVVSDIDSMMDKCTNRKSYDLLKKTRAKGYTHVMAKTDANGQIIGKVDLVKDTNSTLDPEVAELLGDEKMVVIERN